MRLLERSEYYADPSVPDDEVAEELAWRFAADGVRVVRFELPGPRLVQVHRRLGRPALAPDGDGFDVLNAFGPVRFAPNPTFHYSTQNAWDIAPRVFVEDPHETAQRRYELAEVAFVRAGEELERAKSALGS